MDVDSTMGESPSGGSTQAVLPDSPEVNAVPGISMTHSTQPTEIILDESPPTPSTPFRESALKPGETRTPVVKGGLKGLKRPHAASASSSPVTNNLTAAQLSTPASLTASPINSPQAPSAKLSNAGAAVAKAAGVVAAAEQARLLKASMKLTKSPNGPGSNSNRK